MEHPQRPEREKSVRKLNIWIKVIIEKFTYFNIREDFLFIIN